MFNILLNLLMCSAQHWLCSGAHKRNEAAKKPVCSEEAAIVLAECDDEGPVHVIPLP